MNKLPNAYEAVSVLKVSHFKGYNNLVLILESNAFSRSGYKFKIGHECDTE